MQRFDCSRLIDSRRFPIADLADPRRARVVADARAELAADGCSVLRGFFSDDGLRQLKTEAEARRHKAHYSKKGRANVYLGNGNPARAPDHPQNVFLERTNGFVPADNFSGDTASRQLYDWPPLKNFIADCLDKDELFIYEDPVSNMIVNVCRPGERFNWHFDTNEFTITMLLQAAQSGGRFEYVPNLRNPNKECYRDVQAVLKGDRSRVKELDLRAGDLQLFLGRFSLHQVTPNTGTRDRLLLIMSFAEKPGMVGSYSRVKDLYGKTTAVHDRDSANQVRADELLD
ncbi:MAG: hypothetical protein AAF351_06290 [Pseudomonadota bacterium]